MFIRTEVEAEEAVADESLEDWTPPKFPQRTGVGVDVGAATGANLDPKLLRMC